MGLALKAELTADVSLEVTPSLNVSTPVYVIYENGEPSKGVDPTVDTTLGQVS